MSSGWSAVLAVAVCVMALVQLLVLVGLALAARQVMAELRGVRGEVAATLTQVNATLAEVGGLTAEVRETLDGTRRAVAQVGAVVGAGRSLLEGALGAALWRRVAGGAGAGGGSTAVRLGVQAALAIWRAIAQRRAAGRTQAAVLPEAAAAGTRRPLRAGPARRVEAPRPLARPGPDGSA